MMKALALLQAHPSVEFEAAVARTAGMMDYEARTDPDKTYTTVEIAGLFEYLYGRTRVIVTEKEPTGGRR